MAEEKIPLHVLAGPTASGKGAVARRIAPGRGAEIISVDSMKVFRGLDICTAKPSAEDRGRIPHHLIDIAHPWEPFSVAQWLPLCEDRIREIRERGRTPLLVVGTPLYLRSLLFGLFPGPSARWDLRERWMEEARVAGSEELHRRLEQVDPETASRTHPNDLRRIVRALEVHAETGRPLSELQASARRDSPYAPIMAGILWPREELHLRIESRVERMFESGLVEEIRRLRSAPHSPARQALQAVGLKETLQLLDGAISREEAIVRMQTQSRRLARHQMTWFRKFPEITWIPATRAGFPASIAAEIEMQLFGEKRGSAPT